MIILNIFLIRQNNNYIFNNYNNHIFKIIKSKNNFLTHYSQAPCLEDVGNDTKRTKGTEKYTVS